MTCSVETCDKPAAKRGWCGAHYFRWRTTGDVQANIPLRAYGDPRLAFDRKVERTPTCWLWTGYVMPNGYGVLNVTKRPQLAHRVSYALHVGPIPAGLEIDHLCRNTRCVRPDHLEAVTKAENIRREHEARRVS